MFREWVVRLPRDFTFNDVPDTKAWRKVQQNNRLSLRRHDTVTLLAFDESWRTVVIVTAADPREVSLSKPLYRVDMQSRIGELPNDGIYHIEWAGDGYVSIRNEDGVWATQPVANLEQAKREMGLLHARNVPLSRF